MKRSILTAAMVLAVGHSANAQAIELQPYAGAGIGIYGLELKELGLSQKSSAFGGFVKAGIDIDKYFGAELRFGTTGSNSKTYSPGTSIGGVVYAVPAEVSLSATSFLSYFAKARYPLSDNVEVYGLLGGTLTKAKVTIAAPLTTEMVRKRVSGFSYGAGGQMQISEKFSVGFEWMQYLSNVGVTDMVTGTPAKLRMWGASGSLNYHF